MATTESLKAQLATTGTNGDDGQLSLYERFERQRPQIARALPAGMDPDRFLRVMLTVCRSNRTLLGCTVDSLLGALMTCAQTGLEPGPLGHSWIVPYFNRSAGVYEAQWQLGYTGIQELARRSGRIANIEARPVYEADDFDFRHGSDPFLRHRPALVDDRGDRVAFYAYVETLVGRDQFRVMTAAEVDAIRARSKTPDAGPWVTDYDAMGAKTVVRAMRNYLPLSIEMAQAFSADETVRTTLEPDDLDVIDRPPALARAERKVSDEAPPSGDGGPGASSDPGPPDSPSPAGDAAAVGGDGDGPSVPSLGSSPSSPAGTQPPSDPPEAGPGPPSDHSTHWVEPGSPLATWNVEQLKGFCRRHQLDTSGKKAELVARVQAHMDTSEPWEPDPEDQPDEAVFFRCGHGHEHTTAESADTCQGDDR